MKLDRSGSRGDRRARQAHSRVIAGSEVVVVEREGRVAKKGNAEGTAGIRSYDGAMEETAGRKEIKREGKSNPFTSQEQKSTIIIMEQARVSLAAYLCPCQGARVWPEG